MVHGIEGASLPITQAVNDVLRSAARAGADQEEMAGLRESVLDLLEAWGEARSASVGDGAVAGAALASHMAMGAASVPIAANGVPPLPGDRLRLADGAVVVVRSTVIGGREGGAMVVLEDDTTLSPKAVAKAVVLTGAL